MSGATGPGTGGKKTELKSWESLNGETATAVGDITTKTSLQTMNTVSPTDTRDRTAAYVLQRVLP